MRHRKESSDGESAITLNNSIEMSALWLGPISPVKAALADFYRIIDTAAAYMNKALHATCQAAKRIDEVNRFTHRVSRFCW